VQIESTPHVIHGLQTLAKHVLLAASDPAYAALSIEIAAEATRNPAIANLFAANDAAARASLLAQLERGVRLGQVDAELNLSQTASWLIALIAGGVGRAALEADFDVAANQKTLCQIIDRMLKPT
jgi:TetR/AcrR family transcriptional regulator, repressor for uid operon